RELAILVILAGEDRVAGDAVLIAPISANREFYRENRTNRIHFDGSIDRKRPIHSISDGIPCAR
ncbi:hypothetical protein ABTM66_18845, partial [Acinetobacter baumannii]